MWTDSSAILKTLGFSLLSVCSDGAKAIKQQAQESGVVHYSSLPGTPEENAKAERFIRTIVGMGRILILQSGLPRYL